MSEEKTAESKKFPANATKLSRNDGIRRKKVGKSSNEKQGREREIIEWKRKKDERKTEREREKKMKERLREKDGEGKWERQIEKDRDEVYLVEWDRQRPRTR